MWVKSEGSGSVIPRKPVKCERVFCKEALRVRHLVPTSQKRDMRLQQIPENLRPLFQITGRVII
jgi:5-methylcytosine-specific restriction endonuclease McrA